MLPDRVDLHEVLKRLNKYPALLRFLGPDWFAFEFKKSIDNWSLITGWISRGDESFSGWLSALDKTLSFLQDKGTTNNWQTIIKKVRSHSTRNNFKGTLSELALYSFLQHNNIPFDLEVEIVPKSKKNIDVQAHFPPNENMNIEVQWISPSDTSDRGATIATSIGEAYSLDFDEEKWRLKKKVHSKTPKFSKHATGFVALDFTTSPELGGSNFSVTYELAVEIFTGKTLQGDKLDYRNPQIDILIQELIDGLIWFEIDFGEILYPTQRGCYVNPTRTASKQFCELFLKRWI